MSTENPEFHLLTCGIQRFAIPSANVIGSGKLPGVNPDRRPELTIRHQEQSIGATDLSVLFAAVPNQMAASVIVLVQAKSGPRAFIVNEVVAGVTGETLSIPNSLQDFGLGSMEGLVNLDGTLAWMLNIDGDLLACESPADAKAFTARPGPVSSIENSGKSSDGGRIVLFPIGEASQMDRFGLSLTQVPEVRDSVNVTALPLSPPWIEGVALWQNRVIAVLDLGILCGRGPTPAERFLVVQGLGEDELFIFRSGRDVRVLATRNAGEAAGVPTWAQPWAHGAYELDQIPFCFLDAQTVASSWRGGL